MTFGDQVDYSIRHASLSDAEALALLHHETVSYAYRHIFAPDSDVPTPDSLVVGWQELLAGSDGTTFVAHDGVSTLGSVALVADERVPSGLLLKRLHVHPSQWGRGIGSALHDHALLIARARGAQRINLWVLEDNRRARDMYERRGWLLQPGWTLPNDTPSIIDVLYERELAASIGDNDRRFTEHLSLDDQAIPDVIAELSLVAEPKLVWRNEAGGLTFRAGDRFIKWNPRLNGIDLNRERVRLDWICTRHPAPRVLAAGEDEEAQWLVTAALPGSHAIGDIWKARPVDAVEAIAEGLRAIHSIPSKGIPGSWTSEAWLGQEPSSLGPRPAVADPVVVHGDACAPNTLISPAGKWVGNVDFGDLCVGDRWADLAIASMSLDWNFGAGHQGHFLNSYGIKPDTNRIRYYRELWRISG